MKTIRPYLCFLIDDDVDDQEIFNMAIQNLDIEIICETANNGVEALERFISDKDFCPDIVFIDINMPKMNGIQCLQELKRLGPDKGSTIIIYSTAKDKFITDRLEELGVKEFIEKPSSFNLLTESLSRIFNELY